MAVAHDAWSESHTGTSGSSAEGSFSWTHTPAGTPRGVAVFVGSFSAAIAGDISVTYGSSTLRLLEPYPKDTATEPAATRVYFLGSGIQTGAQTVTVTRLNDAKVMYAQCVTVTAGGDTWVPPSWYAIGNDGTYAEQPIEGGSSTAMRYAFGFSGGNDITAVTAGANSLLLGSIDAGNYGWIGVREATAGSGSRNVGLVYATSDDRAGIYLAISEVPSDAAYHDYASQSHSGSSESTSEASFSWDHPGGTSPRAALVIVVNRNAASADTGVTYGGVSMSAMSVLTTSDSAGEPAVIHGYFLSSISSGTQTVTVSRTNNTVPMWAWCVTVNGSRGVEINTAGIVKLENDGTVAQQSLSVARDGGMRYAAGYLGHSPPTVAGANSTIVQRHDFSLSSAALVSEFYPGSGSRDVGLTNAASDDRAIVHWAIQLIESVVTARPRSNVFIIA